MENWREKKSRNRHGNSQSRRGRGQSRGQNSGTGFGNRLGMGRVGNPESQPETSRSQQETEKQPPRNFSQGRGPSEPRSQRQDLYPITESKLRQLLQCQPRDLIMELEVNPGWGCLLDQKTYSDLNELAVVVRVFEKSLKSPNRNVNLGFLRKYFEKFHHYIVGSLVFFVSEPDEKVANLVFNTLLLLQDVCAIMPQTTFQTAKVLLTVIKSQIHNLENNLRGKDRTLTSIIDSIEEQVETARQAVIETQKEAKALQGTFYANARDGTPPNDYKEIKIFPTMEDIQNLQPFVRKNVTLGPYNNGVHYVDTQFRLLREDFVKPLREGVQNYLGVDTSRRRRELRGNSVRYYFDVSCRGRLAALTDSMFLFALQLAPRDFERVNWERSKRFVNGTVIGLSRDDFASMIFAFVVQRNIGTLKKGGLSVECCRFEDEGYLEAGRNYTVIESTTLFEAYRYNLKVLQDIDPLIVPFEKYIVRLEKNMVPPEFITRETRVNLSPIMVDNRNTNTEVLNSLNWPRMKMTTLDDAQYAAVQSAFVRELCLIQGPPGTGKTFVGLLIVETFLLNRITSKPILVVCYTNHALDQFLEGICNFSTKIVRVGGMCKTERLLSYNLAELRLKRRESVVGQRDLAFRTANLYRYRINQLRREINTFRQISQEAMKKLLPVDVLQNFSKDIFRTQREVAEWLQIESLAKLHEAKESQQKKHAAENHLKIDFSECNRLQQMTDEVQSDEEDMEIDEKDVDTDTLDVVGRLLSMTGKKKVDSFQERYIEFALTSSGRPKLTKSEAEALLPRILDATKQNALTIDERWDLYRFWHNEYLDKLDERTESFRGEYIESMRALKELEAECDLVILKEAQVIGMTTTGAAKYKHLYEKLDIEVVIVEEAAELLEAHIVTTISASTRQLILIGDHKQLRPSTADYILAKDFNLDVSLFERLVNNGMPYVCLKLQHRMRPEFVRLLVPHIYPRLECEASVYAYPRIKGMVLDLQLMDHSEFETHDDENRSKTNLFECEMVIGLVRYLVIQGYTADQITVLAMYSGQQFLIKQKMRELNYQIRVTSVDNYQGEENDILVISFVRSNEEEKIGFLRTINRLCVAFSRARHGLFCIGNFTMIGKQLPKLANMLESVRESVTDHFRLVCSQHKTETKIFKPGDFFFVAEGGCNKPCGDRLDCGHMCPKQCHVYTNEKLPFKCILPCLKTYPDCGHRCGKMCGEDCGSCQEEIEVKLASCGHRVKRICGDKEAVCEKLCENRLPCGHMCDLMCGAVGCQTRCSRMVKIMARCGHEVSSICHERNNEDYLAQLCKEPCGAFLLCEHTCEGTCGSCYEGRLHVACQSRCGKTLICGHVCTAPCSQACPPCKRPCENSCVHSRCRRTCGEPCVPCAEPCARRCAHQTCSKLCSEPCSVEPCAMPCQDKLKCEHDCIGFCTDICPDKCLICDDEVYDIMLGNEDEEGSRYVVLDCGHIIESEGMQQWVETCVASNEISMGGISCPLCQSPVRRTNRYMDYINKKLSLIEVVKSKIYGTVALNESNVRRLIANINLLSQDENDMPFLRKHMEFLKRILREHKSPDKMSVDRWSNAVMLMKELKELGKLLGTVKRFAPEAMKMINIFDVGLQRATAEHAGQQQFEDILNEKWRFALLAEVGPERLRLSGNVELQECFNRLISTKRHTEETTEKIRKIIKISPEDRKMIVAAMGFKQGHWYECPNGHVYCIADCGGAVMETKCYACDARIGGASHRLLGDNRVSTMMDGATRPAYGAYNDIAEFDLANLQ